ncbi:MAG: hypothetical protein MUE67_06770 [Anaerolineales bacterium]|nr:hypothetical protein [Anaerolineales bacterium]
MIKKLLYVGLGALITLVVLGAAGLVYAQSQTPPTPPSADAGDNTWPGMGWRGARMGMMDGARQAGKASFRQGRITGQLQAMAGPLHEYKVQAMAEALGLTVDQVEERLAAGETMWQIAQAQGITLEAFQTKMVEAAKNAINLALADGKITQAQADWMLSRTEQMGVNGFGPENCPGMGGRWKQP